MREKDQRVERRRYEPAKGRVGHSVAIYGQRLLFCDQSMREKAWRSRKRRTLLAGAAGELAGATCLWQARMHIL